jgi:hypothetical protein
MAEQIVTAQFGIVCDQVRREDNGKLLIIGVYSHNITVASFPSHLALAAVIGTLTKTSVEEYSTEVRAAFGGVEIYSGKGSIGIKEPGQDILVVPNLIVSAPNEGNLEIKIKFGSGRWKVVTTIPIRKS